MIGGERMNPYTNFAQVYDSFMDNVSYDKWCAYIIDLLKQYNIEDGLMLDLGCGTGTLTRLLSLQGFDMIGIDNAVDMLEIARSKEGADNILYLLQDMRSFELYGTVRSVISICDSINYITNPEELVRVFKMVNNYLDPKGIFIFDFNTMHYYQEELGECTIAEDRDTMSFIWDNYYDIDSRMNEYSLSIFIQEEHDLYHKFTEEHYQRAYTLSEIQSCLQHAGLQYLTSYAACTTHPPDASTNRIYVIAQEKGK